VIAAELRPRGPYSLRVSGRHGSDATRIVGRGMYTAAIAGETGAERVRAWQRPDGAIFVRAVSAHLDPALPLVCDWRNGDVW